MRCGCQPPSVAGATAADRERFVREARIVATLQHPHVVRLYALHEQADGIALALEWIDGLTLDRVVEINGPMHPVDAANAALDVLDALAELHARGVVHRDVKPTNVMRERGGRIVLLDFGVARGAGDGLGEIGKSAGSPAFEAPELGTAAPADARADLYSVGALLYWLVTGKLPVGGRTAAELREQVGWGRSCRSKSAGRDCRPRSSRSCGARSPWIRGRGPRARR